MQKVALLIGISEYRQRSGIQPLKYAAHDAEEMGSILDKYCDFDRVVVLSDKRGNNEATYNEILDSLDDMSPEIDEDSLFLFFFAGHGVEKSIGGKRESFILPANAHIERKKTWLSFNELREQLSYIPSKRRAVFLDCCRYDPESDRGLKDNLLSEDMLSRDIKALVKDKKHGKLTTTVIMNSCSEGERAYEWHQKKHGVFTYYLLEGIKNGVKERKQLTIRAICHYTQKKTCSWSKKKRKEQKPYFQQFKGAEELILVPEKTGFSAAISETGKSNITDKENVDDNNFDIDTDLDDLYEDSDSLDIDSILNQINEKKQTNMITVPAGTTSRSNGNIRLRYDIEMGKYPVTYKEYIEFLNDAGVYSDGNYRGKELKDIISDIRHDGSNFYFAGGRNVYSDCPVENVSWYGAVAYCNWFSKKEGLTPAYDLNNWELKDKPENLEGYRLPTENEWEYTARGGKDGRNTKYSGSNNIDEVAWYWRNSGDEYLMGEWDVDKCLNYNQRTHPVGEKQPNELGIYDMTGNVYEWTNTADGNDRVSKGGDYFNFLTDACELTSKSYMESDIPCNGFRLCRTKN